MDAIRVGIIGLGRAGRGMHCRELANRTDKFKIVAACDIEQERVDEMVEKYACAGYHDIDSFLTDESMELVSIATRSPDHVAHALKALEAGKIVFLEKPISIDLAGAEKLKAAASEYPGKLFLRHNRRFEPAFQHIREIIASGILGNVYEIKLHRHGYQRRQDWQTIVECGGGQLNNWGPHIVDHALQFLASPVADMWSDLKRIAAVGDAEDHVNIWLKGENGRVVNIEISGGVVMGQPTYVVFGDRGSLSCDGQDIRLKYLHSDFQPAECHATEENPPVSGGFGNTEKLQWVRKTIMVEPAQACEPSAIWDHLYAAVREAALFPITIEQGLEVVRVCAAAKKGTEFGQS
jgi:scyllo-inositol 2-dehydrogenase (NADP+)